jgi:transposase-like protein
MSQHFLLSRRAKTLTLAAVFRMSDAEAEAAFAKVRWDRTNGAPVCPKCGGLNAYDCRRPNGAPRFRCRACKGDFSITSGTLFASHKLPLKAYLAAIAIFCNEVKGKSALALSRDLGLSYKAAFVLCHKLREAMAEELKGRTVGGAGKIAEVDGGYFGGYVKPRNLPENRIDRRLARNQTGKRKVVVVVRERNGNSVPAVFRTEGQAQSWIRSRVAKEQFSTPMKRPHGTACTARSKCEGSIIKRLTASTAPARIGRRNISAAFAAPRPATTITSPATTCFATRKRRPGAKIVDGCEQSAQFWRPRPKSRPP